MPERYEAIRDKFKREGLSAKIAKQRAAKIFNATRSEGTPPVTGKDPDETTRKMVAAAKAGKGTLTFTPNKPRKRRK